MPREFREYKDLDLDLTPHPVSGDITPLLGVDAVKRSIRNLLLTNVFERAFRPNIGSRIAHLLFEPVSPLTKYALKDEIASTIALNEPRAKIIQIDVEFNLDELRYEVEVDFYVENISETVSVTVFLERVR